MTSAGPGAPGRGAVVVFLPPLLTLCLALLGPGLAFTHGVSALVGFLIFGAAVLPATLTLFIGAYQVKHGDLRRGLPVLVIGAAPLLVVAVNLVLASNEPPVTDVATNLDNPPALTTVPGMTPADLAYPPAFKPEVEAGYPDLISLQLPVTADAAFKLAREVAQNQPGWRLTRVDEADLTLEGEAVSGVFQFVSDFAIRLLPLGGHVQIDMRSRSRTAPGPSDLGTNARRIRAYFSALSAEAQVGHPSP